MNVADWAWLSLGLSILAYELTCPPGELLSEGWDRYLVSHPLLSRVFPLVMTLHVLNVLPQQLDPVTRSHRLLSWALGGLFWRRGS